MDFLETVCISYDECHCMEEGFLFRILNSAVGHFWVDNIISAYREIILMIEDCGTQLAVGI